MSQALWRIAMDAPAYQADDLSGKGAEITGGRWNVKDVPVVYTSPTQSLACLETIVHLNAGGLPLNRYLVKIDVPADCWNAKEIVDAAGLGVGWDAELPGKVSLDFGTGWLRSLRSPLLLVPSVIVPDEANVLINPRHPLCAGLAATKVRKWVYDPRLRSPSRNRPGS
ncbi:RES family NAD+ phosphorylase [Brevundimonas sp. PAMC22021]|uniref:RES family NAD+ phosphorylase n=1 Tax=Brevundimonas sp. PAMC22021 TaxID=2861285 RepID=UPI001C6355DB|nr:RES family NAD+ phosphorylase [Brevundimonas sp. PAMC22021]QYF87050.1 RES family NAD+ phosphorylase [Brevundimonas sp. PAMC22021]